MNTSALSYEYGMYFDESQGLILDFTFDDNPASIAQSILKPVTLRKADGSMMHFPLILFCLAKYAKPEHSKAFMVNVLATNPANADSLYAAIQDASSDIEIMTKIIKFANDLTGRGDRRWGNHIVRNFDGTFDEEDMKRSLIDSSGVEWHEPEVKESLDLLALFGLIQFNRRNQKLSHIRLFNAFGDVRLAVDRRLLSCALQEKFAENFLTYVGPQPFDFEQSLYLLRKGGPHYLVQRYNESCLGFGHKLTIVSR